MPLQYLSTNKHKTSDAFWRSASVSLLDQLHLSATCLLQLNTKTFFQVFFYQLSFPMNDFSYYLCTIVKKPTLKIICYMCKHAYSICVLKADERQNISPSHVLPFVILVAASQQQSRVRVWNQLTNCHIQQLIIRFTCVLPERRPLRFRLQNLDNN